jgi:hypothetical protein
MYIDPGTGSLIFQILIASGVGFIYIIKTRWLKVKTFFQHIFTRPVKNND